MAAIRRMPREEALALLRRLGFPEERINEIRDHLPDPVDFERDAGILMSYGLTVDRLMDLMGGSP